MTIFEQYPLLGGSEAITNKLPAIIDAFTEFYTRIYGEENRENIRKQIITRFNDTFIVRYTTASSIRRNIMIVGTDLFNQMFGTALRNINRIVHCLYDADPRLIDRDTAVKMFGTDNYSEIAVGLKTGRYPKVNEFLRKYSELKEYEDKICEKEKIEHDIAKKYYSQLVEEFKYLIPQEELDEFYKYGIVKPNSVMDLYFGSSLESSVSYFDETSEIILKSSDFDSRRKTYIEQERLKFLTVTGQNTNGLLSEELKKKNIDTFTAIAKRKWELLQKVVSETFDKDILDKLNKLFTTPAGNLICDIRKNGGSLNTANFIIDVNGKYVLSPIVIINSNDDNTVIHELNHVLELFVQNMNGNICKCCCGWNSHEGKIEDGEDKFDGKYIGPTGEYTAINEYINERIAQEVTDIMHEQGNYIFDNLNSDSIGSDYNLMGVLLGKFYKEFKTIIIKSRFDGKIADIYNHVGRKNFDDLSNLVKRFMLNGTFYLLHAVSSFINKEDSEDALMVKSFVDERDRILERMKNFSASKPHRILF